MGEHEHCWWEEEFRDIPRLVRSIQRIEGEPDCFGTPKKTCDPSSCRWYGLCLKSSKKP